MTEEEQAKELLKKYTAKELDAAGVKKVEDWYASFEQSDARIDGNRKAEIKVEVLAALRKAMTTAPQQKTFKFATLLRITSVAAAILLIFSIALTLWSPEEQAAPAAKLIAISTNDREEKKITLADGSEIWLNPSSRICFAKQFNIDHRTVELTEGEAFFKIAHDENRPFLVKTSNHITTKVLGTSFRIRSYQARKSIDVQVATGKVTVGNSKQVFATLTIGQQISYDKENQRAEVTYSPSPIPVKLEFDGITLQEALKELEYAYSVNIVLEKSLNDLKCEATFTTKQTLLEILDILCSLHHLTFKESDDHKTIKINKL
jgi:transmembrane sensor